MYFVARSDSPATRKRGIVSVDYSQGSKPKEASSGSSFLISLKDFTLLRVIGRGSYAKVLLVSSWVGISGAPNEDIVQNHLT